MPRSVRQSFPVTGRCIAGSGGMASGNAAAIALLGAGSRWCEQRKQDYMKTFSPKLSLLGIPVGILPGMDQQ